MAEWKAVPGLYKPPEGLGGLPVQPRDRFEAVGLDGAALECFRWGSPLAPPFVLEIRRYGAPRGARIGLDELVPGNVPRHDAEPPHLGEMQDAIDQLVPPGSLMVLALASNGPDATYPAATFCAVRVMQGASMQAAPEQRRSGLVLT